MGFVTAGYVAIISVNSKIYLEGPYNSTNGNMNKAAIISVQVNLSFPIDNATTVARKG